MTDKATKAYGQDKAERIVRGAEDLSVIVVVIG